MRKILATLALSSVPLSATADDATLKGMCESISDLSRIIADARDNGISEDTASRVFMNRAIESEAPDFLIGFTHVMVRQAYEQPNLSAYEFSKNSYDACIIAFSRPAEEPISENYQDEAEATAEDYEVAIP